MTLTNTKTLSGRETKLLATLSSQGKIIFSSAEAKEVLKEETCYVKQVLYNLKTKGWLKRLERGKYLIIPLEAGLEGEWSEEPFVIASHLVKPYAISYWSALNFWQFTEQIPRTIFVSSPTQSRKYSEKEILGIPFKFVVVKKEKFFGITKIWIGSHKVCITDEEKTLIDCLDHPEYCGGIVEACKGLWNGYKEGIDWSKLSDYAYRIGKKAVLKRLGYLAELLELPIPDYLSKWRDDISSSSSYEKLDPTLPKKGRYISRWKLQLNIDKYDLINWKEE